MGITIVHDTVSASTFSLEAGLPTVFHCSSMVSIPAKSVLHIFLQCECFLQATVLHKMLQPSSGCSSSGTGCSGVEPPWLISPASKSFFVWTSLCMCLQVLQGTCSSMVFPGGPSLLWAPACSSM